MDHKHGPSKASFFQNLFINSIFTFVSGATSSECPRVSMEGAVLPCQWWLHYFLFDRIIPQHRQHCRPPYSRIETRTQRTLIGRWAGLSTPTRLQTVFLLSLLIWIWSSSQCTIVSQFTHPSVISKTFPLMYVSHLHTYMQAIFDMIDSDRNGFVDFVEYMIAVSANRSSANEAYIYWWMFETLMMIG